jgi:lactam utilization protein B
MGTDLTVVSLSKQELIRIEMICVDGDKDQALAFLKDLRSKITQTGQGMTSHLDGAQL